MAAIPVTFQGILFFSDVGVGGGPMPGGQPPLGIWGPGSPIMGQLPMPGGPPLGMWGPNSPIMGQLPSAGGQPPLGIWGGSNQPFPGMGLPGQQPGIDNTLPGSQPGMDNTLPGGRPPTMGGGPVYPPGIWQPTFPTNPIVIPPQGWPTEPPGDNQSILVVYIPGVGVKAVVIDNPPGLNTKPSEPAEPK